MTMFYSKHLQCIFVSPPRHHFWLQSLYLPNGCLGSFQGKIQLECEVEDSLPHNVETCYVWGFTSSFYVSSSSTVTGQSCNFPLLVPCNTIFFFGARAPSGPGPPHSRGFLDHTQRHTTVGRASLGEWSARRRDLYLIIHNTHNRQTSMPRWDSNPQSHRRAAADLRLRPRGHRDRL